MFLFRLKNIFFSMKAIDVVSVSSGILENLVFAGIIYGWPSLQYMLMKEEYFQEQCNNTNSTPLHNETGFQKMNFCPEMMNTFNLAFTLAIAFQNFSSLLFGLIIDRYGTWMMRSVATGLYSLAFILLSAMTAQTSWLLFPASIFLAVGGLQMQVSNMQLGNLSKSFRSVIITMVAGAFDSGALTFLLMKMVYEVRVKSQTIMIVMTCMTVVPWLRTFLLMPEKTVPFPVPHDYRYGMLKSCQGKRSRNLPDKFSNDTPDSETSDENQNEKGLKACLQNKLFWSNLLYFCVGNLQFVFFVGSFVKWLETIFPLDEDISFYTTLLSFVLLAGIVVAPLNGALTDGVIKIKKRFAPETAVFHGFLASTATASSFSILLSISVLATSVHTSVVLALMFRAFLYSGIANFLAQTFPTKHFGKLYGISATAAGLTSFLQYALFQLSSIFDPTFKTAYYILLCCNILALAHPLLIGTNLWQWRKPEKT